MMNGFRPQSTGASTQVVDPIDLPSSHARTLRLLGGPGPDWDTLAPSETKSTYPTLPDFPSRHKAQPPTAEQSIAEQSNFSRGGQALGWSPAVSADPVSLTDIPSKRVSSSATNKFTFPGGGHVLGTVPADAFVSVHTDSAVCMNTRLANSSQALASEANTVPPTESGKTDIPTVPPTLSPTTNRDRDQAPPSTPPASALGEWKPDPDRPGLRLLPSAKTWGKAGKSCLKLTTERSEKHLTWNEKLLDRQADVDWYSSRHPGENPHTQGLDKSVGGWIRPQSNMGKSPMVSAEYASQLGQESYGESLMAEYDFSTGPLVTHMTDYCLEDAFPRLARFGLDGQSGGKLKNASERAKAEWRDEKKAWDRDNLVMASDPKYAHLTTALTSEDAANSDVMDVGHWMREFRDLEKSGRKVVFTEAQRQELRDQLYSLPGCSARRLSQSELERKNTITQATYKRSPQSIVDYEPIAPLTASKAAAQNRFGLSSKAGIYAYANGTHVRKMADGKYLGAMVTPSALQALGSTAYDFGSVAAAEYYLSEGWITQDEYDQWVMDTVALKETNTMIMLTDEEKEERDRTNAWLKAVGVYFDKQGCTNESCTNRWCQGMTSHEPSEIVLSSARKGPQLPGQKRKKAFNMTVDEPESYREPLEPTDEGRREKSKTYAEWLEKYLRDFPRSDGNGSETTENQTTIPDTPSEMPSVPINAPGWTRERFGSRPHRLHSMRLPEPLEERRR